MAAHQADSSGPRARWLIILMLTSLLPAHEVCAQVPHLIRYQGEAVDSKGVPLEGPYTLTFRLYDAETTGTKVWEETQKDIPLEKGRFSVLLGQTKSLQPMNWGEPCWLSVQVGSEPELSPRQRITSVPTAIQAESAERLANSETISPINLLKDGSFEQWTGPLLVNWQTSATVSTSEIVKQATDQVRYGNTAAKLVYNATGHYGNVFQNVDPGPLRGRPVTFSVWARSMTPHQPCLYINDGVGETESCPHSGSGDWEYLTATRTVSPQATYLWFAINMRNLPPNPVYIDGAMAVAGPMPFAFSPSPLDGMGPITAAGGNIGIGTTTPTNILTIQQGSPTDPIADSWLTYPSDRKHKKLLRTLGPREGRLEQIKSVELYEWSRAPLVSEEEARCALGKHKPALSEVDEMKRALVTCKERMPKFSAKRIGMAIDDDNVPAEVLTFNPDGTKAGIDLLAYVGYLHAALKEAALKIEALESHGDAPRGR